jgi:thioredoxin-dependent peroxiredoxin
VIGTFLRRLFRRGPPPLLPVGSPAPELGVVDHLGHVHSLADYRGRRVCLWFYPKASTPG